MKTQSKIKGILAIICLIFLLINNSAKAQTTYSIRNALSCPITVDIIVYDTGCSNPCFTLNGQLISSNSTFNIPITGCGTICDIDVTVVSSGGISLSPSALANFTSGPVSCSGGGGCTCVDIEYYTSISTFKVY